MTTTTSRRAILAGAAALPALAAPAALAATGIIPVEFDPIFAAIEEHRAAFLDYLEIMTDTETDDDDLIHEGPAYDQSSDREKDAAVALANIQPTTIRGVIALLAYVDHFNRGSICSTRRQTCYSEEMMWPEYLTDDDVRGPRGRPLRLPFAFWIMENARAALVEIASGGSKLVRS